MGIQLLNHRAVPAVVSAITNGDQLALAQVGPWGFQGVAQGSETLATVTGTDLAVRVSTFPGNARPSYIPATAYTFSTSPSNHGGIVGAGGVTIAVGGRSYTLPAGTWVAQNYDCSASNIVIEGDCGGTGTSFPGVAFIGCRMRGPWTSPGWFNQNGQSPGGKIWLIHCDAGGVSTAAADLCESAFETQGLDTRGNDGMRMIRNYVSNVTTGAFGRNAGDAFIENYLRNVTDFGHGITYHLNGFGNSGGQGATAWVRNNMLVPITVVSGGSGYTSTQLTDLCQMAADDGAYPGTGTNYDGSTGYQFRDNYLGGAAYCFQLGVDKSNTAADVKNVVITGNHISQSLYAHGGSSGLGYKGPTWGSLSNVFGSENSSGKPDNLWTDGPLAGQVIASSEITPGP